jgi:hypothetical protein
LGLVVGEGLKLLHFYAGLILKKHYFILMHSFIKYKIPKVGLFNVTTEVYKLPGGWVQREEKHLIIGETDDCFIEKEQNVNYGLWEGDIVIEKCERIYIGPHKSRLIKWLTCQLSLFDN